MTTNLKKLTPNLMVEDVNRTVQFYQEVLGFGILATVPETGKLDWAMVRRDDVVIMFQSQASLAGEIPVFKDKQVGGTLTLHVDVQGIDELYGFLQGRVTIVSELHTTFYHAREFYIEDCNGYVLGFAQPMQA